MARQRDILDFLISGPLGLWRSWRGKNDKTSRVFSALDFVTDIDRAA
jgi:hypothetical protein